MTHSPRSSWARLPGPAAIPAAAACDGCEAVLTPETGRRVTPDGLGLLCARCSEEHIRPVPRAKKVAGADCQIGPHWPA